MKPLQQQITGTTGPLGVFHRYPVLLRLACISVCAEITWATLIIVLEYYFKDDLLKGLPGQMIASRIAFTLLAFTACETIFKVPMGALSDRIGARPVILLALSCAAISPFLMVFVREWYYFIPLRMVDGFAAAALWPSMSALMARTVPRSAKASAMGVFNAAYCVGIAVGPVTGLYLGHLIGNRMVFPFCSLVILVGLTVAWFVLQDPNLAAGEVVRIEHTASGWLERSLLAGRPMLMRMMALYALSQTSVGMLASTVPLYLARHFHIEQADIPRLAVLPALVLVCVAMPLAHLADRIGRPQAVWISYAAATFGMALIAFTGNLLLFGLGVMALAFSFILGTPAWLSLTSLQVNNQRQAEVLSLMQTAQGVGVVCGYLAVGCAGYFLTQVQKVSHIVHHRPHLVHQLKDTVPLYVWFYVATGVFALCLVGTLLWVREPEHPEALQDGQPYDLIGV